MADNDNSSNSIGWFLAGLGLGALVGILYAPKSGRETRETILQKAADGRDYLVNQGQSAREQVSQWVEKGKDVVTRQKDQFSTVVEAGKRAYREATTDKA
jgi:gas vesicle protein